MTVALLPADMTELPFKTLQFYADGREDAWIELATESNPEPEMAAPVLTVASAPAGATAPPTTTPTTTEASPTATSARTPEPSPAARSSDEGSGTTAIVLVVGLLAVVAIGAGAWVVRSRRSRWLD